MAQVESPLWGMSKLSLMAERAAQALRYDLNDDEWLMQMVGTSRGKWGGDLEEHF